MVCKFSVRVPEFPLPNELSRDTRVRYPRTSGWWRSIDGSDFELWQGSPREALLVSSLY